MKTPVIDHQQAVQEMLAERYLLGELDDTARDAYEAHLFECNQCFAQVKAGAEIVDFVRENGAETPAEAPAGRTWRERLSFVLRPAPAFAFAAFLLATASVFQNVSTIKKLKAPQVETRYMLTEQSRAADSLLIVARDSRFRLAIEFERQKDFSSYEARIVRENGGDPLIVPFIVSPRQDKIEISLYAGDLKPGSYSMVVHGMDASGARHELANGSFKLQFQE